MVNVPDVERRSIAGKTLIGLAIMALLLGLVTLFVVYHVSHNFYTSAYYTVSSLFDAIGIQPGPSLITLAPPFSASFDEIIIVTIVDGIGKIVAVGLALAAIIEIITGAGIISKVSLLAARRLRNHVVICGYTRIAERICNELEVQKIKFVVVDKKQPVIDMLRDRGYIVIDGDFTKREVLKSAQIEHARAIVFGTQDDTANLLGIVTAKRLNGKVRILSRVSDEDLQTKMQRAGAELVVLPEVLAAIDLGGYLRSKVK